MPLVGGILTDIFGPPSPGPTLTFPPISLPPPPTIGFTTRRSASSPPASSTSTLPLSSSSASALPTSAPPLSSASASAPPTSALPDSTTSAGAGHTVSRVIVVTQSDSASSTPSAAAARAPQSFLQNKPLSGAIFGLAGLVALVVVVILVTCFVRRSRRRRLLDDAVSFDPALLAAADRYDGSEKGHASNASLGTTGSGTGTGTGRPMPNYGSDYSRSSEHYAESTRYYGPPPPQPYYSGYADPPQHGGATAYPYSSPVAEAAPPNTFAGVGAGNAYPSRAPQPHTIPRVPVPLPAEFGSPDAEPRTLKVTNE